MIIMSAAINKCYCYGRIILSSSAFSFDCSIKIWHSSPVDSTHKGPVIRSVFMSWRRLERDMFTWVKVPKNDIPLEIHDFFRNIEQAYMSCVKLIQAHHTNPGEPVLRHD